MTLLLAVALWSNVGQFWGMRPQAFWRPDGWVSYRDPVLEIDLISDTANVLIDPQEPLINWIDTKSSVAINADDAVARALADGFISEALRQNRQEEIISALSPQVEARIRQNTFIMLALHIQRREEKTQLPDVIYHQMAQIALQEKAFLRLVLERPNRKIFLALLREVRCLIGEGKLRLVPDEILGEIPYWFKKENDSVVFDFLIQISRQQLLENNVLWEAQFKALFSDWLKNGDIQALKMPLTKKELELELIYLHPAMTEANGCPIFAQDYFTKNLCEKERAELLNSALDESPHRLRLLATYLTEISDDLTFDEILKAREKELNAKGQIFQIFLNRKTLSPYGAEVVRKWIKNPAQTPLPSVYWNLHKWGSSSLALIPDLLASSDSGFDKEKRQGLALLLQSFNLRDLWQNQKWTMKQAVYVIDAIAYSKEDLNGDLLIPQITDLILNPSGLYNPDKERPFLNSLILILSRYAKTASPEQLELLASAAKNIFDLPPEKTTEEVLMMLLNSLIPLIGDTHSELQKMLAEMK